jgi:hypothetical protein
MSEWGRMIEFLWKTRTMKHNNLDALQGVLYTLRRLHLIKVELKGPGQTLDRVWDLKTNTESRYYRR